MLVMVGIYYLAATLIFPDSPEEGPDVDDWYDRQKRLVVGGLLVANVCSWIGSIALGAFHPASTPDQPAPDATA
jgi:hypothetical protein